MSNQITFADIWNTLRKVDVSKYIKKKESDFGKELSYISWANAWAILMEHFPNSDYEIVEEDNFPCFIREYGAFCKTKVTIEGHVRSMQLPVMNHSNKAMKIESYSYSTKNGNRSVNAINSFAINKTIMRCLVKNLALFGLGIDIYIDEDLPDANSEHKENEIAWEEKRNEKIGGNGKNKDVAWKDIDGKFLAWCVDDANSKYTKRLKPYAQKEIDWRMGQRDIKEENKQQETNQELENLREDIIQSLNDTMKIINNKDEYNKYVHQIKDAKDTVKLMLIASRLKLTEKAHDAFKKGIVTQQELHRIYAKAGIADESQLDEILNYIHKRKPDETDNKNLVKQYQEEIEKLWKELGYDENPYMATNSMKKHLNTDDMYTITDWKALKLYMIHLQGKLEKDKKDIPFGTNSKSMVNPNYKQDEVKFDNMGDD